MPAKGSRQKLPPPERAPDWVWLPRFSSTLMPPQSPWEQRGYSTEGYSFFWLTGRYSERLTYLMNGMITEEELYTIEMGRTEIWILEKRYAAHPRPGLVPDSHPDALTRRDELGDLTSNLWPGRAFVVLREPLINVRTSDSVFMSLEVESAIAWAHTYADRTGFRTVVALLHSDIYWH